jgi:hypothetical protein
VGILLDDPFAIWADLHPMTSLRATGPASSTPNVTADAKRRQLRATVTSLEADEADLRELIFVTKSSTSEVVGLDLQTKVLNLTGTLNGLTTWLIILTVVLVILAVATLLVQVLHNPAVHVQLPIPTHTAGTTTTTP